jgi:uncharacterized protein (TIGR01777 family)
MKVVIAGGTGFLGSCLVEHFEAQGHEAIVLSRNQVGPSVKQWDGKSIGPWATEIDGADLLINMAGRSVNCRYTPEHKAEIYASRLDSTRVLGEAISLAKRPPKVWMNSSTATIYRHAEDRPMDEASGEYGKDFSVDVAKKWEATFYSSDTPNTRKVALRSAIVMSQGKGLALDHFLMLAKRGLSGRQGSGNQMVSWVHITDWLRAIDWIYDHAELEGSINISSPNPLPNRTFMAELRRAAGVAFGLPLPVGLLKIGTLLIGTEAELVLKSRWVLPHRLQSSGFKFDFPIWAQAAEDLVGPRRNPALIARTL